MAQLVSPRLDSYSLGSRPRPGSPGAGLERGDRGEGLSHEPLFVAPVAFGVLLGAGLGVMLAALMDANANFTLRDMQVSGPLAGWCLGAAVGALSGGFLSAFIGWEMNDGTSDDTRDGAPALSSPIYGLDDEPAGSTVPGFQESRGEPTHHEA